MHLKGKGGKPCFYTGGSMHFEQHKWGNTSPCHMQQLGK
uniref:Uncharacterized protein n=1 Tax=Arundo donax TaxID=35708 RepID=A0A0A9BD16_ARUDO